MVGEMNDALTALERAARSADLGQVPGLVGELERIRAIAWARLVSAPALPHSGSSDQLLTAQEVSSRTTLSVPWLYRHADALPFTRRLGRKVAFSEVGMAKWLATRKP
jgi:predicted DNA-binding transcriptional regulator AlpA